MKIKDKFTARDLGSLFFGFLIIASSASCDKRDSTELQPDTLHQTGQQMAVVNTTNNSLLFQSTFETTADLDQWYMENPQTNSITRAASPVRDGKYAAKFILNKTDPDIWDSKRAELTYVAEKYNPVKSERWYGISMFLPTSYIADPCEEIVYQWKGVSRTSLDGYSMSNPPLAVMTKNGRWAINIKSADKMTSIDLGAYNTNTWTDWVFHIKFSYESDGLLQIWKDGVLVLDRKGPNTYKDKTGNYFKMGLYKYGWKEGYQSNTTQRIAYYDEIRVGNEHSSYEEVAPRPHVPAFVPAPELDTETTVPQTSVPAGSNVVFAVNAGGNTYKASNGITYQADNNYSGGQVYKTSSAISGTTDDTLYQSERFGNFSYSIPVSSGTYEITFMFAEIFHTQANKRRFDIFTEDREVISNLDIVKAAGPKTKFDVVKTVTVTDGMLNIKSRTDINKAKLSAFHVIKK